MYKIGKPIDGLLSKRQAFEIFCRDDFEGLSLLSQVVLRHTGGLL